MDLLPTFSKLANVNLPNDRIYDGFDITPVMFGTGKDPRDIVYYYRDTDVFAIRKGNYKAHFSLNRNMEVKKLRLKILHYFTT